MRGEEEKWLKWRRGFCSKKKWRRGGAAERMRRGARIRLRYFKRVGGGARLVG